MYGYHGKRSLDFLRITMAMPRLIAPAKRLLELGFKFGPFPLQNYQSYEANIDFEIRCVCASTMGHGFEKNAGDKSELSRAFPPPSLFVSLFVARFMVDSDVVGCCWIELPKGKYKMREEKDSSDHDSRYPGKVSVCV